jgi:hypothetical protein
VILIGFAQVPSAMAEKMSVAQSAGEPVLVDGFMFGAHDRRLEKRF